MRKQPQIVLALWVFLFSLVNSPYLSAVASPENTRGKDIEFKGPILAIDRAEDFEPFAVTIGVNGSQVQVRLTNWTRITQGRGFMLSPGDLELGGLVEVRGFFTASGRIVAQRIQVDGSDDLDLEGSIQNISGSWLTVHGIEVLIGPESQLRRSGELKQGKLADLEVGVPVRLRADLDQGTFVVNELEYGERTVDSEMIRFEGVLIKWDGQFVIIDVGITGVSAPVLTDLSTVMEDVLLPGDLVEIEGRFVPGTSLVKATRIAVDSNENGNLYDDSEDESPVLPSQVEVAGTVSSLVRGSDGSPQRFNIYETRITVNSQTKALLESGKTTSLSILQEGFEVEVKGTRASDGSVLALQVVIKDEEDESGSEEGKEDESESENESKIELEGLISAVVLESGTVVSAEVDGVRVWINDETSIRWDSEDDPGQPLLAVGMKVHVKGIQASDGSVLATEIVVSREDDHES